MFVEIGIFFTDVSRSCARRRRYILLSYVRVHENAAAGTATRERQRRPGVTEEETTDVRERRSYIEDHSGFGRAMGRRGQGKSCGLAGDGRRRRLQVSGTFSWELLPVGLRANALPARSLLRRSIFAKNLQIFKEKSAFISESGYDISNFWQRKMSSVTH